MKAAVGVLIIVLLVGSLVLYFQGEIDKAIYLAVIAVFNNVSYRGETA